MKASRLQFPPWNRWRSRLLSKRWRRRAETRLKLRACFRSVRRRFTASYGSMAPIPASGGVQPVTLLEAPRVRSDDRVVGERSVAVRVVLNIGRADLAVSLHRPGSGYVQGIPAIREGKARLNRNHISRTPESVAGAKSIAHRNPFHPAPDAQS